MADYRPGTPDQAAFLAELLEHGLLIASSVAGLYGRGSDFERVRVGVGELVTRSGAAEQPEQLRFPPVLPRRDLETVGYLKSFPHLAGSIFAFDGDERAANEQYERACAHEDWSEFQSISDLVLTPAACYPVYPAIAARGRLAPGGTTVDAGGAYVFRHEPSGDPARMQVFHQREIVRIGEPDAVLAWRDVWRDRAVSLLRELGLDARFDVASDPFFGRSGRMLAAEPARTGAEVRGRRTDRRPGADGCGLVQLPPGPLRLGLRNRAGRRHAAHTRHALASASSGSRSRCSARTGSSSKPGRPRSRDESRPSRREGRTTDRRMVHGAGRHLPQGRPARSQRALSGACLPDRDRERADPARHGAEPRGGRRPCQLLRAPRRLRDDGAGAGREHRAAARSEHADESRAQPSALGPCRRALLDPGVRFRS